MKSAEERKQKRERIANEIVMTKEAQDMLNVTRMRLSQYSSDGRLVPIARGVYLKDDILAFKEAFEDARDNNKWLKEFE